MSFNPPTLPPMQPAWGQFQVWWQGVITDLKAVLNPLLDLNNDDILTPGKKPLWVFENSYLTSEQAGLDAQATTLGITTQKTAYDAAITAMTAYLATLTTPVPWDDFTGNTDVVGVTLRTKFNDVLVAKQALINAMQIASSGDAAAALAAASAAQTTADTAQITADTVKRDDAITVSWTVPEGCISAADAGSDVTITVATHARLYGDGTKLDPVTGTTFTGKAYSTTYGIYYDDITRADATPSYQITTTLAQAQNGFVAGRHRVGEITTPAAAGAPTAGGTVPSGSGVSTGSSGRYPSY